MSLLNNYKLRKRLEKLESFVYERSVGRSGEPSKAYLLWDYLSQNGPKTAAELQATDLRQDVTSNAALRFFLNNNLITKQGDRYSANLNYNWDDVGVLPRTALQEIQQELAASEDENSVEDESPQTSVSRRAQREPRARQVKQNLFSKKLEEVRAAVEAGQDVNQTNDKGKTPLMVACTARNGDTGAIIKFLLDNGADPNDRYNAKSAVYYTVMYNNKEGTLALSNAGADLAILGRDDATLIVNIINSGLFNTEEIVSMITEDFMKKFIERDFYISRLLTIGCAKCNNPELFLDNLIKTTLKVTDKPAIINNGLSVRVNTRYWLMVANALERNGRAIYLYSRDSYFISQIVERREVADKVYELAEKIGNGILKTSSLSAYCAAVIEICNKYNKSADVLENLLKQDIFDDFSPFYQWETLSLATDKAVEAGSTLVRCLNKLKFKKPTPEMLYDVISNYSGLIWQTNNKVPSSLTRLVCRKIKPYAGIISGSGIARIASMDDRLFIEEMIDAGLGEELAGSWSMSRTCRQELEKEGISNIGHSHDRETKSVLINNIIYHIYNDTMDQDIRQRINEDPEILGNERIQDALNDPSNEDSVTAAQLKRQYDQWLASAEKPKYDM